MYLYNITILVNEEIHQEVKHWILEDFFSELAKDKVFTSTSLLKVLNSPNEGITYSLQFLTDSQAQIDAFQKKGFIIFQQKIQNEYLGKVHYFDSILAYQ